MLSNVGKTLCLSLALFITCSAYDIKFASKLFGRGGRIAGKVFFYEFLILKNNLLKQSGGTEAARNQFPFAVLFFISAVDDSESICSGAIISNTWVLSAAHCFSEMYTADLLAGVHNFELEYPDYELKIGPSDVIIHDNYDKIRHHNDTAVVRTSRRPFIFGASINVIPIIPRSMANNNLAGIVARISGW